MGNFLGSIVTPLLGTIGIYSNGIEKFNGEFIPKEKCPTAYGYLLKRLYMV